MHDWNNWIAQTFSDHLIVWSNHSVVFAEVGVCVCTSHFNVRAKVVKKSTTCSLNLWHFVSPGWKYIVEISPQIFIPFCWWLMHHNCLKIYWLVPINLLYMMVVLFGSTCSRYSIHIKVFNYAVRSNQLEVRTLELLILFTLSRKSLATIECSRDKASTYAMLKKGVRVIVPCFRFLQSMTNILRNSKCPPWWIIVALPLQYSISNMSLLLLLMYRITSVTTASRVLVTTPYFSTATVLCAFIRDPLIAL